jgi:hypothetical protein
MGVRDTSLYSNTRRERYYYNSVACVQYSLRALVTRREEHRLRVFENRVLGRIFGPKRGEVTGG